MELIIEKLKRLNWEFDETSEVGLTVYRFKKSAESEMPLSLYLGIKDREDIYVDVIGKRIGFKINVTTRGIEVYTYAIRRHEFENDVKRAVDQLLEELRRLSSEALSVVYELLPIIKEGA